MSRSCLRSSGVSGQIISACLVFTSTRVLLACTESSGSVSSRILSNSAVLEVGESFFGLHIECSMLAVVLLSGVDADIDL